MNESQTRQAIQLQGSRVLRRTKISQVARDIKKPNLAKHGLKRK